MQYAMWVRHSFSLGTNGTLVAQSVDLSSHAGNYYSAISPGFAILSFPFSIIGFVLDGSTLNVWGHALILDEAFVAVCSASAALVVYEIARLYASEKSSLVAALSLAFATPLWPASTVLFIHGVSLMFSCLSVYFVLRFARRGGTSRSLLASGVFLGLAGFVEYLAFLFVAPLALYLVFRRSLRAASKFLIGFLVGPIAQIAYNYAAFQNPFLFPEQLKIGTTGALLSRFDLSDTLLHSAYYFVSPYRGLVFFSPIAILGIFGLAKLIESRVDRLDGIVLLSILAIPIIGYASWSDWAGGLFYGPRFLIIGLPGLIIPLAVLLDQEPSKKVRLAVLGTFGLGSFVEGVGALTTAFSVAGGPSTLQIASLNLPWLVQGKLDAWWINWGNLLSPTTGEALSVTIFVTLWATTALALLNLRRSEGKRVIGLPVVPFERKTKTTAAASPEPKT